MPKIIVSAALLLTLVGSILGGPGFGGPIFGGPAAAAEPKLDRVTLSSGGVGQFEFTAVIEGPATLPLAVPLDQVDDLLKSLRVDDPAGGAPSVRLPGREPLAESFRPLPFSPAAFASPEALLGALVGEAIRVPAAGIAGHILAVTPFETALPNGGGTLTRHRLTIATGTGIATAVLQDIPGVEFDSEPLQRQIASALAAIAAQRVQDRRTMQLTFGDGGQRPVRFGYVVPAPVWKTSYRLTIPAADAPGPAALQAFAVVENLSGRDWRDVEVLLTSGQPVLYHQPLYEAVFTTRPEAPVDVPNRITPQLDAGAVPLGAMAAAPAPAMAPAPFARQVLKKDATSPAPPAELRQSVAQVEFRLANRVSAASGETMLLPIIGRDFPAKRVALFQPATNQHNPLVALLLTNDGAGALPPGLITLFERRADGSAGFIGDARLPVVLPGAERLASFAADLAVNVDMTTGADSQVTSGRAAAGVLELVRRERATTTYRVTTPTGSGRTLLVEQPRRDGWTLTEPSGASVGLTPTHYRISRVIPAGATEAIEVALERPRSERIVLADTDTTRLLAMAQEGRLSPELRSAMTRAAGLRTELDRRSTALRGLADRRATVVADQDRVRKNLAAVPANSELQRRYLGQLQQQETQLATLQAQADAAQRAVDDADAALKDYLATLTL